MEKAKTQETDLHIDWVVMFVNGDPILEDNADSPKFHKTEAAAIKYAKAKLETEGVNQICVYRLTHAVERPVVEPVVLVAG